MFARVLRAAALSMPLTAPLSVGAVAQSAAAPTPTPAPPPGFGTWISGHPVTDLIVILATIVVIGGTYFLRQRSGA